MLSHRPQEYPRVDVDERNPLAGVPYAVGRMAQDPSMAVASGPTLRSAATLVMDKRGTLPT